MRPFFKATSSKNSSFFARNPKSKHTLKQRFGLCCKNGKAPAPGARRAAPKARVRSTDRLGSPKGTDGAQRRGAHIYIKISLGYLNCHYSIQCSGLKASKLPRIRIIECFCNLAINTNDTMMAKINTPNVSNRSISKLSWNIKKS